MKLKWCSESEYPILQRRFRNSHHFLMGKRVGFGYFVKESMTTKMFLLPSAVSGRGSKISNPILSNGDPTLYRCKLPPTAYFGPSGHRRICTIPGRPILLRSRINFLELCAWSSLLRSVHRWTIVERL
ncbi:hypothetical protein AVEN_182301-1 [Araneus ventricosus]|uniref:Uncharacterized protein n=1 Tax=Araneus ventricosus TaxID=182803 RepID=A0A4Y2QGK1_ARAVE|nr:hypothetical protein AVEN_33039-1 [Araneus ventricosus]GBN62081.1 hypothetical protein AVEN_182301-1 [Araneus ventricosus]